MGRGARRRPRLLAAKLRKVREGLGLSQGELIVRLGITDYVNQGDISDFERGVGKPDLLTLKAYADEVRISTDDLIDDDVENCRPTTAQGRRAGNIKRDERKPLSIRSRSRSRSRSGSLSGAKRAAHAKKASCARLSRSRA